MPNLDRLKLAVVLLMPLALVGCFEEDFITIANHPPVVEWQPPDRATNTLNLTVSLGADQEEGEDVTLVVQLITAQHDHDRTVNVAVAEERSDAQEGVHFEILNENNVATIPANSSFGDVDILIHAGQLESGDEVLAVLELLESEDLGVARNMKDFELRIKKD